MKKPGWQIWLGIVLLFLSIFFYILHYLIFRDPHHIFIFLVGDIAFVFIEVMLVTLILHQLLDQRERRLRLNKLNMVIGLFFSEMGSDLIRLIFRFDPAQKEINQAFAGRSESPDREYAKVRHLLNGREFNVVLEAVDWTALKEYFEVKNEFLLRLLQNANLLEHEGFTDMLWAVFHLAEELDHRKTIKDLPDEDYRHLSGDIVRAYRLIVHQWLEYMVHLKVSYPYLFSLALRLNPFDLDASPVIGKS